MNAGAIRHLYSYHFAANRKIWDELILPLPQDLFIRESDYSVGSVRNHIVHLFNVDDRWFSGLCGVSIPGWHNVVHWHAKDRIRAEWDRVEADMRAYLDALTDDMLSLQPLASGNPRDAMPLWQILLHVANHGTDHRAQILALLHHLGVGTFAQDYMFFVWGKL